jgi:ABC-type multidrug transport system fused ATPase/permease subunit
VPQEPFLFTGTVYENIVLDTESVTKQDVYDAAKRANILDDILALPKGFNQQIKELGKNFSGGQKQKLSLARAFLKKSNIYIFDEITSALDFQSEKSINQSLEELVKGKTAILIMHRMTSLYLVSKIIVMDKGRIVEQGTHQQLIDLNGYYCKLYNLQMAPMELGK